jgi:hypothetical protein
MFGFFKKMKETAETNAAERAAIAERSQFNSRSIFFADLISTANDFTYVKFDGTNLRITHDGYSDANLALKELRVLKKQASIKKREITTQYKEIRDEYNQNVGNRGIMIPGGGGIVRSLNTITRASRAAERSRMANIKQNKENSVAPWDHLIDILDRAIVKMEGHKIKYEIEGVK